MELDAASLYILDRLQKDARTSIAELARGVNRAESTVRERVESLIEKGIIRGFHADIDYALLGNEVQAAVHAACDFSEVPEVAKRLEAVPGVVRVQVRTGERRLYVELIAKDLAALERIIETRLAPAGLRDIAVEIAVEDLVGPRPVPLGPLLGSNGRSSAPRYGPVPEISIPV